MNTFYPYLKKELKINKFDVFVERIQLFESVTLRVSLYTEDDETFYKPYEVRYYTLTGTDYLNWNDDAYIISYVKRKLRDEYETVTGKMVYNKLTSYQRITKEMQ